MTNAYIVSGTRTDAQTVQLDEPLPVSAGKVKVIVEPSEMTRPTQSWAEYFAELRARQAARGTFHVQLMKSKSNCGLSVIVGMINESNWVALFSSRMMVNLDASREFVWS